jgi:hypothetical protein
MIKTGQSKQRTMQSGRKGEGKNYRIEIKNKGGFEGLGPEKDEENQPRWSHFSVRA